MGNKVVLYFMRHGQTIVNRAKRVQGWCDGVLTPEGIDDAESVAIGLREVEFKGVYSSDLGRAIKTARIVIKENNAGEDLEVIEMPELREIFFGKYEGEHERIMIGDIFNHLNIQSFEEAMNIPDFGRVYVNTCAALDETGYAENYDQVITRAMKGVKSICSEISSNGGGNVLIVVHGGIIRNLLKELDNEVNITRMDNSSISMVEYEDGQFNVISTNDMSYKEEGEKIKMVQGCKIS